MKKAIRINLERIAAQLPQSWVVETRAIKKNSNEFSTEQKRATGMADDTVYKFNTEEEVFVEINHMKKLKAAYLKNGDEGVAEYLTWLNIHNRKMDLLATELNAQNARKESATKTTKIQDLVNGSRTVLQSFLEFLLSPYHALRAIKWQR